MLAVVGIHTVIGGMWAQHSQAKIALAQPAIEMALDFSSVESNTVEQPKSEQPKSEQPLESSPQLVVKSEPESKPQAKPEPQVKKQTQKSISKNDTNKPITQKTELPQIKTSTGTQQQAANHAPLPSQFVRISQLTFDGSPPVPHYPKQARLNGEEGIVVVRISVDRWGSVENSQVFQSSDFELLDHAALDATRKIRFKPYQINLLSHRVMVDIPFNFILSP